MNDCARLLVAALTSFCASASVAAASWTSQLYPRHDGSLNHTIVSKSVGGRSWRLPDYSFVGYRLGTKPLGSDLPCTSRTVTATGDITTELQAAINAIGAAGGGTVLIPSGRFTLSRSIAVPYSNVSIRGAGSGKTVFDIPRSYTATDELYEGVFTVGKSLGRDTRSWQYRGDVLGSVVSPIEEGQDSALLANADAIAVGQWIVIQQYFWPDFVAKNDASATWPSYRYNVFPPAGSPDRGSSFTYLRKVTAKVGRRISFDAPIPFELDPAHNAIGVRSAERYNRSSIAPRSNLGIAGLSLNFAENDNGPGGRPSGRGIYFEGVRDGWIYDVQVRNFPAAGIVVESSARVTVLHSAVYRAQEHALSGYGYGITVDDSQNVLVRSNYVELSRHNYLNRGALDSMVVFSRNRSAGARVNGDDQHYRTAHAMLWDRHQMSHGTALTLGYRGSESSQAQESNLSSVVWNPGDDGYRGGANGGFISLNPSSTGQAIVVGGTGRYPVIDAGREPGSGQFMGTTGGLLLGAVRQAAAPGSRDQNVLYESLRTPGLIPASLYEGMLSARIGIAPPDFSGQCRTAPGYAAPAPADYTGTGVLVFNEDQLGYTPILGAGCTSRCVPDSSLHNATSGGQRSLLLEMRSSSGASLGVNFRGPERSLGAFDSLTLKVFPTAAGVRLSVRATYEPHTGAMKAYPAYASGVLTAGRWNSLTIPVRQFGSGAFNAIRITGLGAGSTELFSVDDVMLR